MISLEDSTRTGTPPQITGDHRWTTGEDTFVQYIPDYNRRDFSENL